MNDFRVYCNNCSRICYGKVSGELLSVYEDLGSYDDNNATVNINIYCAECGEVVFDKEMYFGK